MLSIFTAYKKSKKKIIKYKKNTEDVVLSSRNGIHSKSLIKIIAKINE